VLVKFNQPMVDLDALDEPDMAIPPFSIDPRVPGRYLWLSTATAALRVEGGLPGDTDFTVLVPGGLAAPSQQRLDTRTRWTFHTAAEGGVSRPQEPGGARVLPRHRTETAIPQPLPDLTDEAAPCAPVPPPESSPAGEVRFPDLLLRVRSPAVSPGATVHLSAAASPSPGASMVSGLTLIGAAEATGELFLLRGDLVTDDEGRLDVSVDMPEVEGFYRLTAVAADDRLGMAVSWVRIWVRTPLEIRAELPRTVRTGDRFAAAAVVRNLAHGPREVRVRIRAAGATLDSDPVTITLDAGETRRVRIDAKAEVTGQAVFQVAAATGTPEHALVHRNTVVEVLPGARALRTAAYGVVDNALRVPFFPPEDVRRDVGGVEIALTPDPQLIITDALLGVLEDEASGADELASTILALHALHRARNRVPLTSLRPDAFAAASIDIAAHHLLALQRGDGGFATRPDVDASDLSTSAWCGAALAAAVEADVKIPATASEPLVGYLRGRLDSGGDVTAPDLLALTLRSLALLGTPSPKHMDALYLAATGRSSGQHRPVPLYARALLMETLHALDPSDVRIEELHRGLRISALERGDGVTFPEDPDATAPGSLHTPDRTDAVVLHAFVAIRPFDTLIPRIVSGLVRASRDGRWSTPRADAWALMALASYYADVSINRPSYEARAWLGERMVLGARIRKVFHEVRTRIPIDEILGGAAETIRIGKRGDGRLFYRLALTTSPLWRPGPGSDHGLLVERAWSLVKQARSLEPRGPFRWSVDEGETVRVRIRVVTSGLRRRVVVELPLPAGFRTLPASEDPAPSVPSPWDSIEERGRELHLFKDVMPTGVYEHTLLLRAVTPGTWRVPPVRARARHNPGVTGRSASEELIITPRTINRFDLQPPEAPCVTY